MNLLKECKTSLIISATILIDPLLLVVSSVTHGMIYHKIFIIAPIVVFVLTFLLSLITKIPNAVRIAIVSVITVAAYICLIYLGILIGNAQFKTYYGEKRLRDMRNPGNISVLMLMNARTLLHTFTR